MAAGRYIAEFTIALADDHTEITSDAGGSSIEDPICAVVDISADFGSTIIAQAEVPLSQLAAGRRHVQLAFPLEEPRTLEQRVYSTGYRPLLIEERCRIVRQPDEALQLHIGAPKFMADDMDYMKARLDSLERQMLDLRKYQESGFNSFRSLLKMVDLERSDHLARQLAEVVGFKGDDSNNLYRAFVGSDQPAGAIPQPVHFTSCLCQQVHFGYDQYRYWVKALKDKPAYRRKQWEFVYIAQVLFEHGMLAPGKRGIVFGAGLEPLPALFASFGAEILATDQAADSATASGWAKSNQHTYDVSALNARGICTDRMFNELVSFMPVDMNDIPESLDGAFDFSWSACSLEHLGSLQHGLTFIENAMRTLRAGGIAVHTTEFNLSSNEHTIESPGLSFYRRCDIESFSTRMAEKGFVVSPMDWTLGEGFAETVVDVPPYGRGEPHLRLRAADYDITSIGLIFGKPLSPNPALR
jgi:hypothetical protein